MRFISKFIKSKKGAAMVEYALLVAGIAIVAVAAVSILGHKTSDLIGTSASVIPGVSSDDNNTLASGRLIETGENANGDLSLDIQAINANSDGSTERLGDNLGYTEGELPQLVVPYP